jgi:hypothetical protein
MRSSPSWRTNDRRGKELFVGQESMHVFANLQLLELLSRRFEMIRAAILPRFSRCLQKTSTTLDCEYETIESFAWLDVDLNDVVSSLFVDFDCRQNSLGIPSTSTLCCGTVARPPMHAYLHCVVMDGDAVTSLRRFSEFKSCYRILSSDYESQMLEAESLDLDLKPWRGWPAPPKFITFARSGKRGFSHRQSRFKSWYGMVQTASPIYPA